MHNYNYVNLLRYREPGQFILFADSVNASDAANKYPQIYNLLPYIYSRQLNLHMRHNNKANCAIGDGAAVTLDAVGIKAHKGKGSYVYNRYLQTVVLGN